MRKFYEKSELWFAVTWIIIYVAVMGNLRNNFGDESPYSMLGGQIIALATVGEDIILPCSTSFHNCIACGESAQTYVPFVGAPTGRPCGTR